MPANAFAEIGVNTSIIVKAQNYEVFCKNIKNVGYEVKTSKRVKFFSPIYKIKYENFEIKIDNEGRLY